MKLCETIMRINENGVPDICTPSSFAKFDSRSALFRLRRFCDLIVRRTFTQRLHEQDSEASEAGEKQIHQIRAAFGDRLAITSAVVAAAPVLVTFVVPSVAALVTAAIVATAVAAMVTIAVKRESQKARHSIIQNAVTCQTAARIRNHSARRTLPEGARRETQYRR
jgi:hypothetical protein